MVDIRAGYISSRFGRIRRGFLGLCFAALCVALTCRVIISGRWNIRNQGLRADQLNIHTEDKYAGSTAVDVYLVIQKSYEAKLRNITRYKFQNKDSFIHYGEPVQKLFPQNAPKVKRILDWAGFFGDKTWMPRTITCNGNITCVSSNRRSDLLISDAVVIHGRGIHGPNQLPKQRLPHQRWVFLLMESPYHAGLNIRDFDGVFNWTATYRLDSDSPVTYFSTYHRRENLTEPIYKNVYEKIFEKKSKLIAQAISNCETTHTNRLAYTRELQKHIPVDRYGRCGTLICERFTPECADLMSQYKFHLSMENSHCREYITEKVSEPLYLWNSVPVVMGGADPGDYEKLLPPGSYIHTSGFNSPKELAEYLLLLDNNPHLYERYHRWRMSMFGKNMAWDVWCDICRKLNDDSLPSQTYRDFYSWYNQDICKT